MTPAQASAIVATLRAAYPNSKKSVQPDTLKLLVSLLTDLDYELASLAVRDVIADLRFFPSFAELRQAYREQAASQRRAQENREKRELFDEPTDDERLAQVARMREFIAQRWGTAA